MTQLLEQALEAVQQLPPAEQDSIASLILQELADEKRWDEAFARTQVQLDRLADKVEADVAAGRVRDLGMDEL
ncbi:MAG: hypothetical protein L0211_22405 [Planctomycetaceae bacterium]|nr:hypothetical protein [Planctomycetaceae bacterium]